MIKISHLSKKFGNLEVLKDINLDIEVEKLYVSSDHPVPEKVPSFDASTSWRVHPEEL